MILGDYLGPFDVNFLIASLILYVVNIIILFLAIFYIINKLFIKKEIKRIKEERTSIYNSITWLLFFLMIFIANLLKCYSLYLVINGESTSSLIVTLLFKIRIIIIYSAFLIKIIYIEYIIKRMKKFKGYFFSVILIIIILIFVILNPEELKIVGGHQIFLIIFIFLGSSILPILYFYLYLKTSGQNRKNAFKISAGTVILGLGCLFRPENLEGYIGPIPLLDMLLSFTYITAPFAMIVATILIFSSLREKKD